MKIYTDKLFNSNVLRIVDGKISFIVWLDEKDGAKVIGSINDYPITYSGARGAEYGGKITVFTYSTDTAVDLSIRFDYDRNRGTSVGSKASRRTENILYHIVSNPVLCAILSDSKVEKACLQDRK